MIRQPHLRTSDQPQPRTLYISDCPPDCTCPRCPPAPSVGRSRPLVRAAVIFTVGIPIGQIVVVAIDWLIGGPGPLVVFGL